MSGACAAWRLPLWELGGLAFLGVLSGIMEKKLETTIMENQMEKKMENEMETGIIRS